MMFAALAMPLAAYSQTTVGNITIGPANNGWVTQSTAGGGLLFNLALDDAGQHCTVNIDGGRTGSGDAPTDFALRWMALAGSDSIDPTTLKGAHPAGWTSLFGERAVRTPNGGYRTLALFSITNGNRTQSVVAWANDKRCVPPLKALVRTVAVVGSASGNPDASSAAAGSSSSSVAPVRTEDLVGRWYGLKQVKGIDGKTLFLKRDLQFLADGTFILEEPSVRGHYQIEGNIVTLPNLYVLTYHDGHLSDGYGMLIRKSR